MKASSLVLLAILLTTVGCGSSSTDAATDDSLATTEGTSGGETDASVEPEPEPSEPVELLTTVPVPVPQPAVPRRRLSRPLQAVWTQVEEQVAIARPDAPEEDTVEAVRAWSEGPFYAWLQDRRQRLEATRDLLAQVSERPVHERALGLALWAYAFEDLGAQVAGSPVPSDIAHDRELLDVYIGSLNEATLPIGQRAIELYADCRERLASLGDDSPWLPWRAYCVQRGQELIRGYHLAPDDEAVPGEDGDADAEGDTEGDAEDDAEDDAETP
ncbi:MAG: hypothetical protein AB7S26_15050 [Sandaracinaceae bacterium]